MNKIFFSKISLFNFGQKILSGRNDLTSEGCELNNFMPFQNILPKVANANAIMVFPNINT